MKLEFSLPTFEKVFEYQIWR